MRRLVALLTLPLILSSACTAGPGEPSAPVSIGELNPSGAIEEAAARAATVEFLRAYAAVPTQGVGRLRDLAGTSWLRRWAHWLFVQYREFPGELTSTLELVNVGSAVVVPVPGEPPDLVRQVEVEAALTTELRPDAGNGSTITRTLDGPVQLFHADPGSWVVINLTRDGVPLSLEFQAFTPQPMFEVGPSLSVTLGSFVSVPEWQFGVRAQVLSGPPVTLQPSDASLVDADGDVVARARVVTGSIATIAPGRPVEGLVSFRPQPAVGGLTLRLAFRSRPSIAPLEVQLDGLVDPDRIAPVSPPSGSP
jgi:hypothetical protein